MAHYHIHQSRSLSRLSSPCSATVRTSGSSRTSSKGSPSRIAPHMAFTAASISLDPLTERLRDGLFVAILDRQQLQRIEVRQLGQNRIAVSDAEQLQH